MGKNSVEAISVKSAKSVHSRASESKKLADAIWDCKTDQAALGKLKASLKVGVDLNWLGPNRFNALMLAALRGFAQTCQELISNGASVVARSSCGEEPLALSAINGSLKTFALLLGAGANAATVDSDGDGIAHKLIDCKTSEGKAILIMALEHGADPDVVNIRGLTPLSILENIGLDARDPRFDTYRHLRAITESKAIQKALGEAKEGAPKRDAMRL
jgi:hypothetical protein